MPLTRVTRRFAAWLAMFAVLVGALAPTVAQAVVSAQGGAHWMQVCSASGMVWVNADAVDHDVVDDESSGQAWADAARHCPLFQLHGAAGLPPAPVQHTAFGAPADQAPAPVLSATTAAHWPAAQSRAPPEA